MPIVAKSSIQGSNSYPNFNRSVPNASSRSSVVNTTLDQFVGLAKLRKVRKGEFVYTQTENVSSIYMLKSGSVKLATLAVTGKEITKAFLMEGDLFGEKVILNQRLNKEYAVAREKTEVYEFRIDTIQGLIKEYPRLLHYLMTIIGQRAIAMEGRLESLVFNDSKTRVIDFLLDLAARRGRPVGYETLISKVMTHQEIANYTATSRQTVTTILNELRTENILTFNRRRLLIRDLGKLAQAK